MLIYEGVQTQSRISEQLCLSRQTLNSAFKLLVKKDLIRLEPLETDQRTKRAILTSAGQELAERIAGVMHYIEGQAWGKLEKNEQEMLAKLTQKYACVLKEILSAVKN